MDINTLLKGVQCSCGRFHTCPIRYVYVEADAARRLKDVLKGFQNVLIVSDENTENAAGERVRSALSEFNVRSVIFPGNTVLVPDEKAVEAVEKELQSVDVLVGIGSGVIQDLCKYVSFFHKIPYCVFATAPSMDGYASNGAAMILKGMKETVAAGLPLAILADPDVLRNAPFDMIRAGYGDILGKYSALNDWKLSRCINDEYFCSYICDLTMEQVDRTLALREGLMRRDTESVKTLMEALIVVGILMSFAGSSRPASGSEHHMSHFFEITGILHGDQYLPHGIDVAYSTVLTAKIREKILARPFPPAIFREPEQQLKKNLERIYRIKSETIQRIVSPFTYGKKRRSVQS